MIQPGLCGACLHAKITATKRGTTYLRCTRAAWDKHLVRYPQLPVLQCAGFEPGTPPDQPPAADRRTPWRAP